MLVTITSQKSIDEIEKYPLTTHNLAKNTYEVIARTAQTYPDKLALQFVFSGNATDHSVDLTYKRLFARITQTANAFHQLGIKSDDVVTMLLPNLPQTHFAMWGAEAVGIANPINMLLETDAIVRLMNAAKSKILVTFVPSANVQAYWDKIEKIAENVSSLSSILTIDMKQFSNEKVLSAPQQLNAKIYTTDFDELIAKQNPDILESKRNIQPEDIACYFHTGGTTGTPKIAIHTHGNQVFSAWMAGLQMQWQVGDVLHCGLPLFHVNGPLITGLAPFTVGATVLMTSPYGFKSPQVLTQFWQLVERYRITFFMAVPTVYKALLHTWSDAVDISSLKIVACGAAPMPIALLNEFIKRTHIDVVEAYGLTEGTVFSTANPAFGEKRSGSIGLRIPYQAMKVVQLGREGNIERDCAVNEIGTIIIKGPNVFKGYLNIDDNKHCWVNGDWLNTGDLARVDADGYFWLTGRSKDLIIRGGHNIDPKQIEEVLNMHPSVELAAAVGKPDKKFGELPVAYVTLRGGQSVSEEELLNFTREHMNEKAALPTSIYILKTMPVTAIGKIYKPDLRNDAIVREFKHALQPLEKTGTQFSIAVQTDALLGLIAEIKILNDTSSVAMEKIIHDFLDGYTTKSRVI